MRTEWEEFCQSCTHMQPVIEHAQYFQLETTAGTETIPADVIGRTVGTAAETFANYCEGSIVDPDECIECKTGWIARMSAPGYMDCTEWAAFDTEQAAEDYLVEMYGE